MELTSPGPSKEAAMDKSDEGTDADGRESVEALEAEELVEPGPGNGEPSRVPSPDKVSEEADGLAEHVIAPTEPEPEEDLVEEAELEPEPRKAHSEDLDSDERLSPGTFIVFFRAFPLPVSLQVLFK